MEAEIIRNRTKLFALRVIKLFQALPKTAEAQIIGKQLLRSATSVAANYRAACRGRSTAEFFSKMCIVVEEADETVFWIEILQESEIMKPELLTELYKEAMEILKIMSKSRKTTRKNR